jgi:hypothetical protein
VDDAATRAGLNVASYRSNGWSDHDIMDATAGVLRHSQSNGPTDAVGSSSPITASPAVSDASVPLDTSFASALRYGLHNAAQGFGETLKHFGATTIGQDVEDAIAAPRNYQPATIGMSDADHQGHLGEALEFVPRFIVEHSPDLAGATAAGLAGTAIGGPIGALAGAATYGEARHFGENLAASTAASGQDTPGWNNVVDAGTLAGAEGAMEGVVAPGAALRLGALGARAGSVLASAGSAAADGWAAMSPVQKAAGVYMLSQALPSSDDVVQSQAGRRRRVRQVLDWVGKLAGE